MTSDNARKPRWWLRALWVVAGIVLLAGIAEVVLRMVIPTIVAQQIREQLHLPESTEIDVGLGGSAVLSAVQGTVGPITVDIPNVEVVEGIVTTLHVRADSVPFNPTEGEIHGLFGSVTIPPESIGPVIAFATQNFANTGEVRDGSLEVGGTMEIFGQPATVSVELRLAIEDGQVQIVPAGVQAAGFDFTADELDEVTGRQFESLLQPQQLCVAEYIPAGITLEAIRFDDDGSVSVDATFSPHILSDPSEQQPGSCQPDAG